MPFQIVRNDITRMAADAIVSTTDPLPAIAAGKTAFRKIYDITELNTVYRGLSNSTKIIDIRNAPLSCFLHLLNAKKQPRLIVVNNTARGTLLMQLHNYDPL